MNVQLRTTDGEITLKLLQTTPSQSPSQPDLQVEISATVQPYSVQSVKAWLEWPDIEAFKAELVVLVREVRGEAKLYAMSPENFELVVANLDLRGHFGINFSVGSRLHTDNGQFPCLMRGGLEIELGQVEALLQWLETAVNHSSV
ncbi:MAG: hypothetical protein ACKOF9_17630 [Burkholderiales bacterium]